MPNYSSAVRMGCSLPCLKTYSMAVGTVLMLLSVAGIGFCLFMLFGEPFAIQTQDTYAPNWEDLGEFCGNFCAAQVGSS